MLAIPDPGSPHDPSSTTPLDSVHQQPTWADIIGAIPTPTWTAITAVITTVGIGLAIHAARRRRREHEGAALDKLLTFFAAAVATGVVGTGMWVFFGDTLHITNPILRGLLFAMFEVAMLAEALRSRKFRLGRAATEASEAKHRAETLAKNPSATFEDSPREIDVDGAAVWVLAMASGGLAASHETAGGAIALRLIAPIVAAWLWERGLAGELRQFTVRRSGRPNPLRVLWERLLVARGLAEPTGMTMGQRAQVRHLNRLARARFRVYVLDSSGANRLSLGWAKWMLRRRFMAAVDELDLAGNAMLRQSLQERIAVLMAAESGTSPESVQHLKPWESPSRESESRRTVIDSTATSGPVESPTPAESATPVHANRAATPATRNAQVARRTVKSTRTESAAQTPEPTRIGGDEAQMVAAIRPFVAQWRAANGKAPGQQVTRDRLREFGFRVGTKKAGELAESADSANLAAAVESPAAPSQTPAESPNPAVESGYLAESAGESDSDSGDSDSGVESAERSA